MSSKDEVRLEGKTITGRKCVTTITAPDGGYEGAVHYFAGETLCAPTANLVLGADEAVRVALATLAEFAPDKLAQPPYVPLAERVGQFVWSDTHLNLVKIIGPDLRTDPLRYSDYDYAEAIDERGRKQYIHNKPDHEWWVPTKVEIVPEQWKPKR